jgi:hypothetical protein
VFCKASKAFLLKKANGISKGFIIVQLYNRLLLGIQTAQVLVKYESKSSQEHTVVGLSTDPAPLIISNFF